MQCPWPLHYDLEMDLRTEEPVRADALYGGELTARCRLTLVNRGDSAVTSVPFLLYRMLDIELVRYNGARADWTREVTMLSGVPRWQVAFTEVALPEPLESGQQGVLEVEYAGPVCGYREVAPYMHDSISQDFTLLRRDEVLFVPVPGRPDVASLLRRPDERFTFRLDVTTDPGLTVATAGDGQVREVGDRLLHRWMSDRPDWRLDVAVAPYVIARTDDWPGVALYHLPGDEDGARVYLRIAADACRRLSEWFGPVPGSLNVIVVPDGYGGQASTTHLLVERWGLQREESETGAAMYERLLGPVSHEVIHLWGVPSREEAPSRFLDEGITHYLETVVSRRILGSADWAEDRFESFRRHFRAGGEEAACTPLETAGSAGATDSIARGKGPWLLRVWEEMVGVDTVLDALSRFFTEHRSDGADLCDFALAVSRTAERFDDDRFLADWIHSTRASEYLLSGEGAGEMARRYF